MDLPFRYTHHMCLPVSVPFWSLHMGLDNLHALRSFFLDCILGPEFPCLGFLADRLYACMWLADISIAGYE